MRHKARAVPSVKKHVQELLLQDHVSEMFSKDAFLHDMEDGS